MPSNTYGEYFINYKSVKAYGNKNDISDIYIWIKDNIKTDVVEMGVLEYDGSETIIYTTEVV